MSDSINPTPHLNRARVKQTALEIACMTRGTRFSRVGLSFLERTAKKSESIHRKGKRFYET